MLNIAHSIDVTMISSASLWVSLLLNLHLLYLVQMSFVRWRVIGGTFVVAMSLGIL